TIMRYGLIGNCKTAALVHETGSIDWCCLPNFDSPSAFGRILDAQGGHFQVSLAGTAKTSQVYLPQTNILQTEFDDGENAFVVLDFMPRYREGSTYQRPAEIHRILKPLRGKPLLNISFRPRLNYARGETSIRQRTSVMTAANNLESIFLYSSLPLQNIIEEKAISLEKEEYLLLSYHEKVEAPTLAYTHEMFEKTKNYWETWSSHCRLPSLYSEAVLRSALVLKLMTYDETGAIIAAPTSSLPEILHEERNWDYRYCWLRDASLMLDALKSIGHFEEARAFIHFLLHLFESKQAKIQIVYGIDGRTDLEEKILDHLKGYKGSGPVRIGNNACHTQQNDIFGEIVNTLYLYYFHYEFEKMPDEVWSLVKFLVNTIARDWPTEDAGIWEFRHRKAHFTFSKTLSWVALDRGIKIAQKLKKDYAVANWRPIVERIRGDIEEKGWNEEQKAYTQIYHSSNFDASLLLMNHYGFIDKKDPRWISTVLRCEESLVKKGYGFRYTAADDFGKPKNAFIVASLWIAKALCSIGEKERGKILFENILSKANHLGLLSEDIDPETGELLGNFPQAYSHMEVINTANRLDQA
ncbi:MAG: glycoside hydrolase family 15 protein, partial [bacterium]|nr:glycoside hydrolase family 15 protein [bacterium]